jgi:hypothetical protein
MEVTPAALALISLVVTKKDGKFILDTKEVLDAPPTSLTIGDTKFLFNDAEDSDDDTVFWHYIKD